MGREHTVGAGRGVGGDGLAGKADGRGGREGEKEGRGRSYWETLNQNKGQRAEWKRAGKSQQLPINDVQKAAFFHKF